MRIRSCVLAAGLVFPAALWAAEPCVSGVPVGQRPGPYSFNVATGPERGRQHCYICETGEGPGIVVFARSLSEPLGRLLNRFDKVVSPAPERGGVRGWVTFLGEKNFDLDAVAAWGKKQAVRNVPLGVFDDEVGPPAYQLAEDADVTVMFFARQKVVANFAFRKGELDAKAVEEVMKAVPLLEKK